MRKRWSGLFVALALWAACRSSAPPDEGGVLRVGIHTEPQTWNRLLASDRVTHLISDQLHEKLLRLNPETQKMEPALAESWEFSEDGKKLVFHLRGGVRFSDGEPFGARDVAFTFRALYTPSVASPLVQTAEIDGRPLGVEVVDERTVAFTLPRRTAVVERAFDSISILPAHLLEEEDQKAPATLQLERQRLHLVMRLDRLDHAQHQVRVRPLDGGHEVAKALLAYGHGIAPPGLRRTGMRAFLPRDRPLVPGA